MLKSISRTFRNQPWAKKASVGTYSRWSDVDQQTVPNVEMTKVG